MALNPSRITGYYFCDESTNSVRIAKPDRLQLQKPFTLKGIFLALEPICNFRCPYCYTYSKSSSKQCCLSKFAIEQVISDAEKLSAKSVVVAGDGEPFLSRHIWAVIKTAEQRQMTTVIFTNGSCIDTKLAKDLYSANVSLILKLNSFDPSTQDALIGVKGGHKKIYKALEILMNIGFEAPRFAIQSLISKENLRDIEEVFLFCRRNNIVPYIETYVAVGQAAEKDTREALEPSQEAVIKIFKDIQMLDKKLFGIEWNICSRQRVIGYGPCNKNRFMVSIASNGDVYRCVTESKLLGNIRRNSLRNILMQPKNILELAKTNCTGCNSFVF